jgi:hypothetical protein
VSALSQKSGSMSAAAQALGFSSVQALQNDRRTHPCRVEPGFLHGASRSMRWSAVVHGSANGAAARMHSRGVDAENADANPHAIPVG